jgi:hypothetical protein
VREPSALFTGAGWREGGGGLLLSEPVRVLTTQDPAEVPALLAEAEAETQRGR